MLQTQLITTDEQLNSLEAPWNQLSGGEPLRSWDWLATWWKHYGPSDHDDTKHAPRRLHALAVYDRNALATHQLVGIAPWYLRTSKLHGDVLRPLGSGEVCTDHV